MSAPVTLLGAGLDDDSSASTAIGFSFPIDGLTATNFTANANGWALLNGSAPSSYNNALFADTAPGALVAPWWDDLRTAVTTGYVKTELQGTSPNRCRVIEWRCYGQYSQNATDNDTLVFQACLYETGKIEFRYAAVTVNGTPSRAGYSATCGVRGDCSSGVNGHIRDFFGTSGTPAGSTTPANNALVCASAVTHWPGDPFHIGIPVDPYTICLDPVIAPTKPRILATAFSAGTTSTTFNATNTTTLNTGAGPVTVHTSGPLTFEDFLADLAAQAAIAVPAGAPWSCRYDSTSKRVTLESGTGGTFTHAHYGNLAAFLGMGATGTGARTYTGWKAPAGALECLSLEVDPPHDASRLDVATFRHGRSVATVFGNSITFKCRAWIASADKDIWQAGYVTTGKVRVYQAGGSTTPYSATNLGGYLEGYIVSTSELQVHGNNENVLSWTFTLVQPRES